MNYGSVDIGGALITAAGEGSGHPASDTRNPDSAIARSGNTAGEQTTSIGLEQNNSTWTSLNQFYERNIGLSFVFYAQFFNTIMNTAARLLTTNPEVKFHALEVVFMRMLVTSIMCFLYTWYNKVPDFPLGPKGVRGILLLRGVAGFIGLFGLYYSLSYLDISDATVISFLIPTVTAFVCWVVLREPFTVREATASVVAFVGVMFVARPAFLFPVSSTEPVGKNTLVPYLETPRPSDIVSPSPISPAERTIAVLVGILGTISAACAYTTIRVLGDRVHALTSVNYFAVLATVISAAILLVHPELSFVLPNDMTQWALCALMGVSGFSLQFLLTAGLQREKAGRATNVIYTQLAFALIIERIVWGTTPAMMSLLGSVLIIAAAIWVSLQKSSTPVSAQRANEEDPLLRD